MRSGRQIALLLLLQNRGGTPAGGLAAELGVSVRSIYRDVEELSQAGVPVYAERGNGGGIRLVDGYRTRLTGLDLAESEALSFAGWSGVAEALGVHSAAAGAERKLLAALPPSAASNAQKTRSRIHFDLARWYDSTLTPPCLPELARAVWDQRAVRIDYTSWKARAEREIDPFGLVLKNAVWYLVGRHEGKLRTYRASKIASIETLSRTFSIPAGFDLRNYWDASKRRFETSLARGTATVRVAERDEDLLSRLRARSVKPRRAMRDPAVVTLPIESIASAALEFLALADRVEVLAPPELRRRLARLARATAQLYANDAN